MSDERQMTIHFNNGTKMEVAFPTQIKNSAGALGEGRIGRTQPMIFSADETADVGIDLATPVVASIGSGSKSKFSGRIPKVTVEVK